MFILLLSALFVVPFVDSQAPVRRIVEQPFVNFNDVLLGPIGLGNPTQLMFMALDPTTKEFFVVDSNCEPAPQCRALRKGFHTNQSSTFQPTVLPFRSSYRGEQQSGRVGTEEFTALKLGKPPRLPIPLVSRLSGPFTLSKADGVMGFGLSTGKPSFLRGLMQKLDEQLVTFFLSSYKYVPGKGIANQGQATYGGDDLQRCAGVYTHHRLMKADEWKLRARSASIGSMPVRGGVLQIQPGMRRLYGPAFAVMPLLRQAGASYDYALGEWVVNCGQIGRLPSLQFELADGDRVQLAGRDYAVQATSNRCVLALGVLNPQIQRTDWILGDVLLRSHCVQLDFGRKQMATKTKKAVVPAASTTFADFDLDGRLLQALNEMGWEKPTTVQGAMIPQLLQGANVCARARTGTGKTGAFLLPLIQRVLQCTNESESEQTEGPFALVLAPTKELAKQIFSVLTQLIARFPFLQALNLSEREQATEELALGSAMDVLVATPARLVEVAKKRSKLLKHVKFVVLDEADLFVSFGYREDLIKLKKFLPVKFQSVMTSATLEEDMSELKTMFASGTVMSLKLKESQLPSADQLSQYHVYVEKDEERFAVMISLLKLKLLVGKTIFFVDSVERCYKLHLFLQGFKVKSCVLNSQMPANSRSHVIQEFNEGKYRYIIASDARDAVGPEQEEEAGEEPQEEDGGKEVLSAITKSVIREARLAEIKRQLLESKRLEAYFAKNPREKEALENDRRLFGLKLHSTGIADVADYMVPKPLRGQNFKAADDFGGSSRSGRHRGGKRSAFGGAGGPKRKFAKNSKNPLRTFTI
ncbi:RNA helicase [Aphelenchoides fujianensis]|nr:RNA helicase [Aphelenchoides fujianensis]